MSQRGLVLNNHKPKNNDSVVTVLSQKKFAFDWQTIIAFRSRREVAHPKKIGEGLRFLGRGSWVYSLSCWPSRKVWVGTPSLVGRQCWGKSILPGAGYGLGTYRTVDIFNFSHFSWTILEKLRFLCFYIIESMARKGYLGPKSDFRGSKIPPRGASSTWNM